MNSITLTPELIAMIMNIIVMVGGLLKLERRLTKLETVQELISSDLGLKGVINRRKKPRE